MLDRLFVYGTLRKDVRNSKFHLLAREASEATFVGHARIQGRLFDLGEYPGLVLSGDPGSWVNGEVYAFHNPQRTLSRLDAYEGCGLNDPQPHDFERVERDVVLDSGARHRAWLYVYNGPTADKREILSGDYRNEPP
jgi:gamma-glutamylcyclotransferase (GGCT)/AIG2-like uncharacterized protein YtfP